MGLLDFFRKKEIEELKLEQVDSFLEKRISESNLDELFLQYLDSLSKQLMKTEKALYQLDRGELLNDNVPKRALQILKGNKENYIRKVKVFLAKIKPPRDLNELESFLQEYRQMADDFQKETRKNYMVINEFLRDELYAVVNELKGIEKHTQKMLQTVERSDYYDVAKAKRLLHDIEQLKINRKRLTSELKKLAEDIDKNERTHKRELNKLKRLQESEAHTEVKKIASALDEVLSKKGNLNQEINLLFSELNRPLKKYKRVSLNEKLIDEYLGDAVSALAKDTGLVISDVLGKMKKSIHTLDLKNPEKIEANLTHITKDFLEDMQKRIDMLENHHFTLKQKHSAHTILDEIIAQEEKLNDILKKTNTYKQAKAEKEKLLNSLDKQKLIQDLSELLNPLGARIV